MLHRYYNVEYEPDPLVMCQDEVYSADNLIELTPNLPVVPKNDLDDNNAKGTAELCVFNVDRM